MARTTRVGKRAAATEELADDAGTSSNDDIDSVLESLTGEAEYVVLWRLDGPKGKQEHVDKVALSRFNSDYVTERHGGGEYLFRVYGPVKAGGGRNVVKYKEFSIDRSIPPKSGSALLEWQKANGIRPTSAANGGASHGSGERSPWLDIALATLPAVATGLLAVFSKEKQTDPVLMALLNKMVSGDKGGAVDPVELQRLIADERERAYNHGRESAPRGEGEDGTARVLESTLPGLVDIFKESVANDRKRAATMRAARVHAATLPTPAAASGPQWLQLLRQYIPQLIAAMGAISPAELATRVLDNLPVKVARELSGSCEAENFVSATLEELPDLTTPPERRAYFTALLTAVQDELAPVDQGGDDTPAGETPGGGAGDSGV